MYLFVNYNENLFWGILSKKLTIVHSNQSQIDLKMENIHY